MRKKLENKNKFIIICVIIIVGMMIFFIDYYVYYKIDNNDIMNNLDTVNFKDYKSMDCIIRSCGLFETSYTYMVIGKSEGKPFYSIEYSFITHGITNVKINHHPISSDSINYLTKNCPIVKFVDICGKYKLFSLSVDSLGNAYFSKTTPEASPLIKISTKTPINIPEYYENIKGSWYGINPINK